ncbi:MAG: hypothetical protein IPK15_22995 [Verrucomicrobia bacterium]|nr:hypothetical protein [Verrucomicrobiota bacterium]
MSDSLSPRRRRLRSTVVTLVLLAFAGIAAGTAIYLKSRPTQYRPDEQSADITSDLARNLPPDAPKPRFTDVTRGAGLDKFRNFAGHRSSRCPKTSAPAWRGVTSTTTATTTSSSSAWVAR